MNKVLSMSEERQRARLDFIGTLDRARASLARGKGTVLKNEEGIRRYCELVKQRGRAELARRRNLPSP